MIRRALVAGALVAAAVAATAGSAPAGPQGAQFRVDCAGVTAIDVYFWPTGHPAIPELNFPAFAPPHVEFYRARDPVGFLVYAGAGPRDFTPARACQVLADRAIPWGGGPSATATEQQKLRCTLAGEGEMQVSSLNKVSFVKKLVRKKGSKKRVAKRVRVVTRIGTVATFAAKGGGAAVSIQIKPTGSTMRYDTALCAAIPLTA